MKDSLLLDFTLLAVPATGQPEVFWIAAKSRADVMANMDELILAPQDGEPWPRVILIAGTHELTDITPGQRILN